MDRGLRTSRTPDSDPSVGKWLKRTGPYAIAAFARFGPRPGKRRLPQKPAETRTSTPGENATARVQPATASDVPEAKSRRSPSPRPGRYQLALPATQQRPTHHALQQ